MQNRTAYQRHAERLALEDCVAVGNQLTMSFAADELRFRKRHSYSDVDFEDLKARYGEELIERLCFHVAALEAIPLLSLQPGEFDLGRFARFHTARFEDLWRTVFLKAGAQWRYENDLASYRGPRFATAPAADGFEPATAERGFVRALCFCGGGKDSLAMLKLFESAGVAFSAFSYSHPAYGEAEPQLQLIGSLLDSSVPARRHAAELRDDFAGSFGMETPLCAETPISIFSALPVVLQHGYEWMALGNERSADEPNLRWDETGESVNHQWGKSLEAELLINEYIRDELISNVRCFSALRPLHDPLIFYLLRRYPEAVKRTHSCNLEKPWCRRCAKCAYVGLGFLAYLPFEVASEMTPPDLFDNPANQVFFEQLLGLGAHKPFECVGETDETRLAFEICRSKGMRGRAIDVYTNEARVKGIQRLAQMYAEIDVREHSIPPPLWRMLSPLMAEASEELLGYVSTVCGFERKPALASSRAGV